MGALYDPAFSEVERKHAQYISVMAYYPSEAIFITCSHCKATSYLTKEKDKVLKCEGCGSTKVSIIGDKPSNLTHPDHQEK